MADGLSSKPAGRIISTAVLTSSFSISADTAAITHVDRVADLRSLYLFLQQLAAATHTSEPLAQPSPDRVKGNPHTITRKAVVPCGICLSFQREIVDRAVLSL